MKIEIWHIKFYNIYFKDKFRKKLVAHENTSLFKCQLTNCITWNFSRLTWVILRILRSYF